MVGARDESRHARDPARVQRTSPPVHTGPSAARPILPFRARRATIAPMTTRRDQRQPTFVPVPRRPVGPPRPRSGRAPRPPLVCRVTARSSAAAACPGSSAIGLVVAVIAVGVGVLFVGLNGAGAVRRRRRFDARRVHPGGHLDTDSQAVVVAVGGPPSLDQPSEPYTSQPTVDLVVTVPAELTGSPNHRIRYYLALPGQQPTALGEVPIATTPKTVIPGIELTEGRQRLLGHDRRAPPANPTVRPSSATSSTRRRPRSRSARLRRARSSTARRSSSRARPRRGPPCWHATRPAGRRSRGWRNPTGRSPSAWHSPAGSTRS